MVRIFGIVLPDDKRIDYGLTMVYGIGWARANEILKATGIAANLRISDLSEDDMRKLIEYVESRYKIEGDLREEVSQNIRRLRDIGSYRGMRHAKGLPSRGQRTKSNARTRKGKRKTIGALTKEAWAKLEQQKVVKK